MNNNSHGFDLPHFLRKPVDHVPGKLDDTMDSYQPLLAAWLIEMALALRWCNMTRPGRLPSVFEDDDFLSITGIAPPEAELDDDGDPTGRTKATQATLVRTLKNRLTVLRKKSVSQDLPLFANVHLIGELFGLSDPEKAVLTFAAAVSNFTNFSSAIMGRNERVSTKRFTQILAALTGQPEEGIRAAILEEGMLIASGIVSVEQSACDLESKVSSNIAALLLVPHANEGALTQRFLKRGGNATVGLDAFPHLSRDIDVLRDYLLNALSNKEPGANVLFYGPPGTGKTELAKAIAEALGLELYEIGFADADGDPIHGVERLRSYNLCQKLLSRKQNALLMFDEIEDVFESRHGLWSFFGGRGDSQGAKRGKAWINRTLERNATPAIWITNDANIDSAYLRRFDYSIRFPIPPQKVRLDIARHHLGVFAPNDDWLGRIAANDQTSPAQMEHAAKVARIAGGGDPNRASAMVQQALDRSATLLGQKRTPARNLLRTRYDLSLINTDIDVGKIICGLKQRPHGSFCFFGPAGTGKSELARHIADEVGMPVLLRRASDLLSMWVGENEKNIAEMFAEARQQEAVLVLDEADSFLADRRDARNSWEVTQVNELLTQMEACEGVFICTTNLMDKLDQASLRRFSFKVKFDYLTQDQRWVMFRQELERLGGDPASAANWDASVRRLDRLTPGDFAVAARQFELWDLRPTGGELYEQLFRECVAKGAHGRSIGFSA
jgi:transitional endoplasmic reticulum ATPase